MSNQVLMTIWRSNVALTCRPNWVDVMGSSYRVQPLASTGRKGGLSNTQFSQNNEGQDVKYEENGRRPKTPFPSFGSLGLQVALRSIQNRDRMTSSYLICRSRLLKVLFSISQLRLRVGCRGPIDLESFQGYMS